MASPKKTSKVNIVVRYKAPKVRRPGRHRKKRPAAQRKQSFFTGGPVR